jgi:GNAT superfamily N-acetyltransferase
MARQVVPIPDDSVMWRTAARWCLDEWSTAWPEDTEETYLAHYRATATNPDGLPLVLAAIEDGDLVGVVTLVEDDELPDAKESPWLAACVVSPTRRGCGVGRDLVLACEEQARRRGFRHLHLFTWSEVEWYEQLGWRVLREVEFAGRRTTVMQRDLVL